MNEKEMFMQTWEREYQTTLKTLKAFPAERLDLKPHERSRSAKDLLWTIVSEEKVNIAAVNFSNNADHTTSTFLTLETKNLAQLGRLLSKIEGVKGVISAVRIGDGALPKPGASPDGQN